MQSIQIVMKIKLHVHHLLISIRNLFLLYIVRLNKFYDNFIIQIILLFQNGQYLSSDMHTMVIYFVILFNIIINTFLNKFL